MEVQIAELLQAIGSGSVLYRETVGGLGEGHIVAINTYQPLHVEGGWQLPALFRMLGMMRTERRMFERRMFGLRRSRTLKRRTILFGLKSSNCSREMLLRLLSSVVMPGDEVLAVHVQEHERHDDAAFDLNTFHIHEDLCKSKQVDFQVKVCAGESYISELTHQVRVNFATILALGCSGSRPDNSTIANCLKTLPPTCTLVVLGNGGRILIQRSGTSQQGSTTEFLRSTVSSATTNNYIDRPGTTPHHLRKSLTMPSPSTSAPTREEDTNWQKMAKKTMPSPDLMAQKLYQRFAFQESKGQSKRFASSELRFSTRNFSPEMVIGEGGHSKVYTATLGDGRPAAVKVLKITRWSAEDLLQEVEILSDVDHENIVQIIGYCYDSEVHAVVYDLLQGSLRQKLRQLRWKERMGVAVGVAKALVHLHHSCDPPIIHRDVKSSNILLFANCHPQLSDFGSAMVFNEAHQVSAKAKPVGIVGTFGYLAPEYIMYGKVDEKVDVYSYGVVLLELISGREAIQTNQASSHESLVLWARSLLSSGLYDRLIDPNLNGDYNEEEMRAMVIAARLCLVHSSSRRPTMKLILQLFVEPENWLKKQRDREELLKGISSKGETGQWRHDHWFANESLVADDT